MSSMSENHVDTSEVKSDGTADEAQVDGLVDEAQVPADPALLAAEPLARDALLEITTDAAVGPLTGSIVEGDGVLTLLFDCMMPGYPGWNWAATVARADADAAPTVLEVTLLPAEGAITAPEWVPWADRLAELAEKEAADAEGSDGDDDDDVDDESQEDDIDGEDDDDDIDETDLVDDELDDALDHLDEDDIIDDESAQHD